MFENVGKRMKTVTKVFFWIAEISFALVAFISLITAAMNEKMDLFLALVILLIGVPLVMFFIWVSYLFMYGFCELVDKTTQNEENFARLEEKAYQTQEDVRSIKYLLANQFAEKE